MVVERQTSTTNFSKKIDHQISNPMDQSELIQMFFWKGEIMTKAEQFEKAWRIDVKKMTLL